MSGFDAGWLAAREAVDHRARALSLQLLLSAWTRRPPRCGGLLRVVDLGCGTGSNLRFLAPRLSARQHWTLIDDDAALLGRALTLPAPGRVAARVGLRADIASPPAMRAMARADLVTAAALLDLVSLAWCRQLLRHAGRPGRGLYVALSYDGRFALAPREPLDDGIRALVNRHQRQDKGLGPALGPAAATTLASLARAKGALVRLRRADWRLTAADHALLAPLIDGWAGAAIATAPERAGEINAWLARRRRQLARADLRVRVGHLDMLALWPKPVAPLTARDVP